MTTDEIEAIIGYLKTKDQFIEVYHKTTFKCIWYTDTGDDVEVLIEVHDHGPDNKRRYQVVVEAAESGETVAVSSLEENVITALQIIGWHKLDVLAIPKEDPLANLTATLRKGVYYRTNLDGLNAILADGFIRPNRGDYPFTWPVSENSFSFSKGYVSLFDFESATEGQVIRTRGRWQNHFVQFDPFTVVFKLNRLSLQEKLIPHSAQDPSFLYIPHVEVWYPEPIPLSAVQGVLLVIADRSGSNTTCEFDEFASLHDLEIALIQWQAQEVLELLAYKLWEQRGRPLWDDQRDWYEAVQLIISDPSSLSAFGIEF